ncbi:MAG: protein-tyrosine phosphatase family protein [Chlamydiales bacterium]
MTFPPPIRLNGSSSSSSDVFIEERKPTLFPDCLDELVIIKKPFPKTTCDHLFLAVDQRGNKFVVKHHPREGFIANEYDGNRAFHALGLPVPEAKLYRGSKFNHLEGDFLVLQYIESAQDLSEKLRTHPSFERELAKNFIKICLMGAWDFIGLCWNNVIATESDHFYIDHGLTFGYMHDGAKKSEKSFLATEKYMPFFKLESASDWWETCTAVPEILSMRDYRHELAAAVVFGRLTKEEIQEQINDLDLTNLLQLSVQGDFPLETMAILERRANWLKTVNLSQFEPEWNRMNAERAKAIEEATGGVPVFETRGIELSAVINGGIFSQISEEEDPGHRPPHIGLIYREATGESIWLKQNEDGTLCLPTWKAAHPENYILEVVRNTTRITGTRVRISNTFVSSDVEGSTRFYVVDRMGGDPRCKGMRRFSLDEALETLIGSDREVLKAYLTPGSNEIFNILSNHSSIMAPSILIKECFQERVLRDFQIRWLSNRVYALITNPDCSKEEARAMAKGEFSIDPTVIQTIAKKQSKALSLTHQIADYTRDLLLKQRDPHQMITFEKVFDHRNYLPGFYEPHGMTPSFMEPPFQSPHGYNIAAGTVIQLKDQRYVLAQPTGRFAGYSYTFPKGRPNDGESLQQAAIREAREEAGLEVELTGVLGDYRGGSTFTRYYTAKLVGGDPSDCDFETSKVHFVPPERVEELLQKNDRQSLINILTDLQSGCTNVYTPGSAWFIHELESSWRWLGNYHPIERFTQLTAQSSPEKNRSEMALPFDHNLVPLTDGRYVNGSLISLPGLKQQFIAAQAPMSNTLSDFWYMAFDSAKGDQGLIVMVTDLMRGEQEQSAKYWPEEHATLELEGLKVVSIGEEKIDNIVKRHFKVTIGDTSKVITQLHRTEWPDKGLIQPDSLALLINEAHKIAMTSDGSPMIVHCSRGQGRTGVVILAYALIYGQVLDTPELIKKMREQRPWLVPALDQAQLAVKTYYEHQSFIHPHSSSTTSINSITT